jgi:glycosyltransferase involved in cell wall biosynthesis
MERYDVKVLHIHNHYRFAGGEDAMFDAIVRLLRENGDEVRSYERDSKDVAGFSSKLRASFSGIYSFSARREVDALLTEVQPDAVHVHNLYPLISASVMSACYKRGFPVLMRCPDYRFICPTSCCYNRDGMCERCKKGSEYWCVIKNCRGNYPESVAYALRASANRMLGLYRDNVDCLLPPSQFVSNRLVEAGFPERKVCVIPNMVTIPDQYTEGGDGEYVGYAGRLTVEKGIDVLMDSAVKTGLPIRLAGAFVNDHKWTKYASDKIQFLGALKRAQLSDFYARARFVVVPSVWHETFGLVAAEAMAHGRPVIVSKVGGLQEVIEDGVTGLLVEPGDADDLAAKMEHLWNNPDICRQMGLAARKRAVEQFSKNAYYPRLKQAYNDAIATAQERTVTAERG